MKQKPRRGAVVIALSLALITAAQPPSALAQAAPTQAPRPAPATAASTPRSLGAARAGLGVMLLGLSGLLAGIAVLGVSLAEDCHDDGCPGRSLAHVGLGLGLGGGALTVGGMYLLNYGASPAPRPRASAPALVVGPSFVGARWSF